LVSGGARLLRNEAARFELRGQSAWVVGVDDPFTCRADEAVAFGQLPEGEEALLLLAHSPATIDAVPVGCARLVLSGHTHGGQLSLPGIGTPFAPIRDKRYVRGLHRWNDRWLHITKGVGNLHGMRFNCRPEVSVLTLV
jgi:predicted MPP superfamily phosphohydrolase